MRSADLFGTGHQAARVGPLQAAITTRDQFAALLPIRERVSGPEHPDTLTDRSLLARWTGAAGNPAAARDQYTALLSAYERALGPEHPDTLLARLGLARWTGVAGGCHGSARPVRRPAAC